MSAWGRRGTRLAGPYEIGEALRGMQGQGVTPYNALAAAAQGQFGTHEPVVRQMPSQYKDSSFLGIVATQAGVISIASGGLALTGATTSLRYFKPERVTITEVLTFYFTESGNTVNGYFNGSANDVVITGALSGADNVFPNAPSSLSGIHAAALAPNSLGVGVSWPTLMPNTPFTLNFLVLPSALGAVAPPSGFTFLKVDIAIYVAMFGEQLR